MTNIEIKNKIVRHLGKFKMKNDGVGIGWDRSHEIGFLGE